MKKKTPARTPARAAPRGAAATRLEIGDVLKLLDADMLELMRQTLRAEMAMDEDLDDDDPVPMFGRFLDRLETFGEEAPDDDDEDFLDELVLSLTQLGIDDNGGDPEAREQRAAVYEKLDDAIAAKKLDASGLVLIAKVLTDSGWRVPESL